eukprot:scaffold7625_cov85-Skeletonema_dohrnii-CCMP3373.AAC.1
MKFHSKCLIVAAAQSVAAATSCSSYSSSITSSPLTLSYTPNQSSISANNNNEVDVFTIIDSIRGGAIEVDSPKKKKKSSKSSKTKGSTKTNTPPPTSNEEDEDAKLAINTAMKDSDAAHTLGEAICARAHILRKDKLPYAERTFDSALVSLGLSLGTAGLDVDEDDIVSVSTDDVEEGDEDAESKAATTTTTMAYYQYGHNNSHQQNQQFVQPSTSAVIANYFLKTHGGTHLLQCVLSLLASVLGMACLVLPPFPSAAALVASTSSNNSNKVASLTSVQLSKKILNSTTKHQLLQQTLLLAMAKHVSALVGAVILGAQRIPTLGIRNARRHLELVALDPVGQYLFYCSILVVWLGWFGGGGNNGSGVEFVSGLRRS